ncbi:MAG: PulJ/GspJ family protein [Minisyncoccales bacterium]
MKNDQSGLTLIEVVVALLVGCLVFAMSLSFFHNSLLYKTNLNEELKKIEKNIILRSIFKKDFEMMKDGDIILTDNGFLLYTKNNSFFPGVHNAEIKWEIKNNSLVRSESIFEHSKKIILGHNISSFDLSILRYPDTGFECASLLSQNNLIKALALSIKISSSSYEYDFLFRTPLSQQVSK